jgi:plasmid stability protein
MSQLLVRDVLQDVVEALKRRAAEHERAALLREETRGRISVPSEVLIRQDRDER